MKSLLTIAILFALCALSQAVIGDYTHFVGGTGGTFNRAGWHPINNFAVWNSNTNKWMDYPRPSFGGGSPRDMAVTSDNKVLIVGDFTSVNGQTAYGIAVYDGGKWCSYPHLQLYRFDKSASPLTNFPLAYNGTAAGRAYAVENVGDSFYIFGGSTGTTYTVPGNAIPLGQARVVRRVNFNQIGTTRVNVAGLVRLNYANNNFTVVALPYAAQGGSTASRFAESVGGNETRRFPGNTAPVITSQTKMRVNSGGNLFVVQDGSDLYRWRVGDGTWLTATGVDNQTNSYVNGANVTFRVLGNDLADNGIGGRIVDFDMDSTGTVYAAGSFNTLDQANGKFLVAVRASVTGNTVTWVSAFNVPSTPTIGYGFNQTQGGAAPGVRAIALESTGVYFVGVHFQDNANTDPTIASRVVSRVYRVTNDVPAVAGSNFGKSDGTPALITKLALVGSNMWAFGDHAVYNQNYDLNSVSERRWISKQPGWSVFNNNDWQAGGGGGITVSSGNNVPAQVRGGANGMVFWYVANGNAAFDLLIPAGLIGYSKKKTNDIPAGWKSLGDALLSNRGGNGVSFGQVRAIHFPKSPTDALKDSIIVGGTFQWIGNTNLGSVASVNVDTGAFSQVGGGLWDFTASAAYAGDQVLPSFTAGTVWDLDERSDNYYAVGSFGNNVNSDCLNNVAKYDFKAGGVWEALGAGCDGTVRDVIIRNKKVYVGGDFDTCGERVGTRHVAYYDEDDNEWKSLGNGLNGNVHVVEFWRGKLYAGGTFTNAGGYRMGTGLAAWDDDEWEPVLSRCQGACSINDFTYNFNSGDPEGNRDPITRSATTVSSMRPIGRKLYVQGNNGAGNNLLLEFTGRRWNQLGVASGATCNSQGCISRNVSDGSALIAINFGFPSGDFNPNYKQYSNDEDNWVETFNGFDGAAMVVASASTITISALLAALLALVALLF